MAKADGEDELDRATINSYTAELHAANVLDKEDRAYHREEQRLGLLKELEVRSSKAPNSKEHILNASNVQKQLEKLANWGI